MSNRHSGLQSHQVAWLAVPRCASPPRSEAGLRKAARNLGVELPVSYTEAIATDGFGFCEQLGVTRLGQGLVIHTAPESRRELPVLLG
jgi:hypothetical protein